MKKLALFLLLAGCAFPLLAQKYQIKSVDYDIQGCGAPIFGRTQDYALAHEAPVDKKKVFNDKAELDAYLEDYEKRLNNLRAFETIEIEYELTEPEEDITGVSVYKSEQSRN